MKPVCVYYHTHWDREWYQPFRSYQVRFAEVVDEILDLLERDELPCFMLDGQTIVLRDYLELRPENKTRLEKLIHSCKLSIGPWLVMPDEFLVCGESLLRNLMLGIQESKEWHCQEFTGYLPDTFGHSGDIPTLLQGVGIDSAVLWRGISPEKSLFNWQAPSGATVKTLHLTDGYLQISPCDWTLSREKRLEGIKALVQTLKDASPNSESPVLIPAGGDHLGPILPEERALLKEAFPKLFETTPVSFMQNLANATQTLQTTHGELSDHQGAFLLPGVWSARLYLKQENRRLEHALLHRLEPLLALVQTLSKGKIRYPASELKLAWETLILNHPHDSICGCSVDEVHRENEVRFLQVQQLIDALENRALAQLRQVEPQWSTNGFVLNTGDHTYSGVALIAIDGPPSEQMPAESVPIPISISKLNENDWKVLESIQIQTNAFQLCNAVEILQDNYLHNTHRIPQSHLSKKRYQAWAWIEHSQPYSIHTLDHVLAKTLPESVQPVQTSSNSISNGLISLEVDEHGGIHLTQTKQKYQNLMQFTLQDDQGDSYNTAPVGPVIYPEFKGVSIVHEGPLHGEIQVRYAFSTPRPWEITLTFILEAGSPLLQIETLIQSHPLTQHKLQIAFETGKPVDSVSAESHYSEIIRQYDSSYRVENHMPAKPWKELKSNTGPIQRYVSTNGHSWITEGLTEYEIRGSKVGITLLRAFDDLSSNRTGVRGAQAGPIFKTPEGTCQNRVLKSRMAWLETPQEAGELDRLSKQFYGVIQAFGPRPNPDETCPSNSEDCHSREGGNLIREACTIQPESNFSLIHWDAPGLVTTACHWLPTEQSGVLLLRLLNQTDKTITTQLSSGITLKQITPVNLLNEPISDSQPFGQTISITAKQLQTFLIQ